MEDMFQSTADNLLPFSMDSDQLEECVYTPFPEDVSSYEYGLDGVIDELTSQDQSYPSSSIPNSPGSSESSVTESVQQNPEPQHVIFPSYAAQASQPQMPVIKCEPVIRPAPSTTATTSATTTTTTVRQPAAKRGRGASSSSSSTTTTSSSSSLVEAKFPDLLNSESMNSYMQSLAKGKSEDIELFRNVLRCHGSLTPEAEKQLKHLARQVKNRESAQLSRQRKREYVQTLKSVIDKMRGVDNTLRADLNSVQSELAQYKTEAERWQNYAHDLQKLLKDHGIEAIPKEPETSVKPVAVSSAHNAPQVPFPETIFDGPCGFGHMTPPKSTGKRRTRAEKSKEKTA